MLRRRPFFLFFPLLAASLLSCVDLPAIEQNTCGNGFIEVGEDCDHLGGNEQAEKGRGGAICNASGTANQCRLSCTSNDECAPYKGSGWRCGVDNICRQPKGQAPFFQPVSTLIPGSADELFSGDFDGDGRKDVLAVGQSGFDVHYFTSDGDVATSTHISGAPMVPAIGKLTTSQADDFTVDVGQGIGVMLGQTGQTVEPTSYLSLDLKKRYPGMMGGSTPDDVRLLVVDTGEKNPMGDAQGPKPLALASKGTMATLIDAAADPNMPQKVSLGGVTVEGQKFLGSIPVSFLGPAPLLGSYRQRFLLAAQGAESVLVVDPGAPPSLPNNPPAILEAAITLPKNFRVHGAAFFADVNADGFADILVGAASCIEGPTNSGCVADLEVAYGDGAGGFFSGTIPPIPGKASPYVRVYPNGEMNPPPKDITEMEQYLPLAVGQLNVDPRLDFVNALGIYVSDSVANPGCTNTTNHYCRSERPSAGETWSEAQIGDFNANGHLDVAATSQRTRGIDFFNGTGTGVFNTFSIPTEGIATHLAVGDFDGDLLTDLAFDSVTPRGQEQKHTLFVSFGGTSGAPALPLSMGEVPHLLQIVAGNITSLGGDAATDLVLLAGSPEAVDTDGRPNPDWKVGLSLGNSTRQLQAPLVFFATGSIRIEGLPMASAIGFFNGNGTAPPPAERPLHTDLAALIASFKDAMPAGGTGEPPAPLCLFNAALWMLPATGEAAIDPPTDDSKNTRTGMTASDAVLGNFLPLRRFVETVPINLHNGTGADDLLITYPTYDTCDNDPTKMPIHGALYRAQFDADGQPHLTLIIQSLGVNQFLRHVRVGDVNGDGFMDIVALQEQFVLDMGGQTQSARVVVLLGDTNGSFSAPSPPKAGEIPSPTDLVLVNTDGDINPEIVVLARNAGGRTGALFRIDWIQDAKDPSPPVALQITDSARKTPSVVLDQPSALVGGDFDGDGVDDVAVAGAGGIQMYKGVAK